MKTFPSASIRPLKRPAYGRYRFAVRLPTLTRVVYTVTRADAEALVGSNFKKPKA